MSIKEEGFVDNQERAISFEEIPVECVASEASTDDSISFRELRCRYDGGSEVETLSFCDSNQRLGLGILLFNDRYSGQWAIGLRCKLLSH